MQTALRCIALQSTALRCLAAGHNLPSTSVPQQEADGHTVLRGTGSKGHVGQTRVAFMLTGKCQPGCLGRQGGMRPRPAATYLLVGVAGLAQCAGVPCMCDPVPALAASIVLPVFLCPLRSGAPLVVPFCVHHPVDLVCTMTALYPSLCAPVSLISAYLLCCATLSADLIL
jgi:hypothetical protein